MKNPKTKPRVLNETDLNICHEYQRMVIKSRVAGIVRSFNHDAFNSILIGERSDGSYWVVDGQQRLTAARQLGMTRVPCNVFQSTGPAHEAAVFILVNGGRTGVSAFHIFRAAVAQGDRQSLAIVACVENAGLAVLSGGKSSGNGWPNLRCVVALQNSYERGGAEHLTRTLNIICEAWRGEDDATRSTIVDGLSLFLSRCSECDDARLTKKLKAIDPMAVLRFADSQRQLMGGGRVAAASTAFLNYYNKGAKRKVVFA